MHVSVYHLTCGISFPIHSINLILFTLLVHTSDRQIQMDTTLCQVWTSISTVGKKTRLANCPVMFCCYLTLSLFVQMNTADICCFTSSENLCYVYCFQTNKKKLFVLREESSSGPARLEYYDNEKKFKTGVSPKRCIVLKNCFSINAKSDARHRHAIILYTKDDCFGVAFDSDADCQEWLSLMLNLRSQSIEESTLTRPLFGKFFWLVKHCGQVECWQNWAALGWI